MGHGGHLQIAGQIGLDSGSSLLRLYIVSPVSKKSSAMHAYDVACVRTDLTIS